MGRVENHTGRGALHNSNPCVRTECDLSFNKVCLELDRNEECGLCVDPIFHPFFVIPDPKFWIILSLDPKNYNDPI